MTTQAPCLRERVNSNTTTGELIRALRVDPTKDYQPLGRPPGPQPRKPR